GAWYDVRARPSSRRAGPRRGVRQGFPYRQPPLPFDRPVGQGDDHEGHVPRADLQAALQVPQEVPAVAEEREDPGPGVAGQFGEDDRAVLGDGPHGTPEGVDLSPLDVHLDDLGRQAVAGDPRVDRFDGRLDQADLAG